MNVTGDDASNVAISIITASVWTITTLLILVFNTVCLAILPKIDNINASTKVFLAFMTVGDLNLSLFIYLPMIGVSAAGGAWPFGAFCSVQAWIIRQGLPMNMMSVLLVTTDRYVAIVYPLRYGVWVTPARAKVIACGTALITHLYALYFFLSDGDHVVFNETLQVCVFGEENSTTYAATFAIGLVWFFIHLAMYVKILKVASRHAVCIAAQRNPAWVNEVTSPNRRSFTTIAIINAILFVGWGPFSIVCVASSAGSEVPALLVTTTRVLLATVSWVNVIVYYVRNKEFRKAVHDLFVRMKQWFWCDKRLS